MPMHQDNKNEQSARIGGGGDGIKCIQNIEDCKETNDFLTHQYKEEGLLDNDGGGRRRLAVNNYDNHKEQEMKEELQEGSFKDESPSADVQNDHASGYLQLHKLEIGNTGPNNELFVDLLSANKGRPGEDDAKERNTKNNSYRIWKARIVVIIAAMLTGTNFVVIKILNESMPVGIHSMLRFGIGALFSSPFLFLNRMETGNKECVARGIESGLWDGVAYLAQALGLRTVPVAVSSFICAADIALILILDRVTGVSVVCRQWIGAVLAMVGVAVLTTLGSSHESSGTSAKTTDLLLTLLQPIGFGVAFWRLGHAMDRFPGQAARLTAAQTQAIFVLSIALAVWEADDSSYSLSDLFSDPKLLFFALYSGLNRCQSQTIFVLGIALNIGEASESSFGSYPWSDWFSDPKLMLCILYAGLGTDLLANYLVNLSRDTLTSLESFLIYSTEQVWAALFAWILLGESIGWGTFAGAVLITLGCVLGAEELEIF